MTSASAYGPGTQLLLPLGKLLLYPYDKIEWQLKPEDWRGGGQELIDAEGFRRWRRLLDQLDLVVRRLKMFSEFEFSSVESVIEVVALLRDIEAAQAFLRSVGEETDVSSPRISEIQEKMSLQLAKLEIAARKVKELPGTPGRPGVSGLKTFRDSIEERKDELLEVITAAYERLRLK